MALISRNGKGRGNAGVSGNGEVETGRLFSGRRLFFISSTARGLFFEIRLDSTRASREAEESLRRVDEPGKADVKNRGILCFVQEVPMPGRSGLTWWSLQNRGSPRPRSRAERGGRAPEAPKGGRRVPRRGGHDPSP